MTSTLPAIIFDEPCDSLSHSQTSTPSTGNSTCNVNSKKSITNCISSTSEFSPADTTNKQLSTSEPLVAQTESNSVKNATMIKDSLKGQSSSTISGGSTGTKPSKSEANSGQTEDVNMNGPQEQQLSSVCDKLSSSEDATTGDHRTAAKDSTAVEKMDVDDPEKQLNCVNEVGLSEIKCRPKVENISTVQDTAKSANSNVNFTVESQPAFANTQPPKSHGSEKDVLATVSQMTSKTSQVSASKTVTATLPASALLVSAAPSTLSSPPCASTLSSSVSTVKIEATAGLNSLTPETVLKFIADELMKESDAGKALLTGVAASISTSEGKVIVKPEPAATNSAGVKPNAVKAASTSATPGGQTSSPVRLILQTVPGHQIVPGGLSNNTQIQVVKTGPQVVHTGISKGKPLTPIAPAQRIVISSLPSGTILGSQGQLLAKQGQVLGSQNISGTKVIRMTIPRGSAPLASSTKVVTATSKASGPVITVATQKTPVTPKAKLQTTSISTLSKPVTENFPMRHAVVKDPKVLINMNLKNWKRRCSRKSVFVLDTNMVRALARRGGLKEVQGFHYNTKWNSLNYPHDFPRPSLMAAWRYRTQSMRTLAAAAIQIRILNASMKWDEMNVRPPRGSSNTLKTSSGKIIAYKPSWPVHFDKIECTHLYC